MHAGTGHIMLVRDQMMVSTVLLQMVPKTRGLHLLVPMASHCLWQ
jgi:hypothetical protein